MSAGGVVPIRISMAGYSEDTEGELVVGDLEALRTQGFLRVGVSHGFSGMSSRDQFGVWQGLDIDIARAIALAIFSSPDAVEFIPLTSAQRFEAVLRESVDLGCFNSTVTFERENIGSDLSSARIVFGPNVLHDGEVFAVRRSNIDAPRDAKTMNLEHVASRRLAALRGSTTNRNVELFCRERSLDYTPVYVDYPHEVIDTYLAGDADIICLDSILLASSLDFSSDDHVILDDVVTLEPMAPAINSHRPEMLMVVKWVVYGLIEAERLNIGSANVAQRAELVRGLGTYESLFMHGENGGPAHPDHRSLLPAGFMRPIIEAVGNYGDIFERNLGAQSPLQLDRRSNRLVRDGGALSSPRFI